MANKMIKGFVDEAIKEVKKRIKEAESVNGVWKRKAWEP